MNNINIFDPKSITDAIENSQTTDEAKAKIRDLFQSSFSESFQDFLSSLSTSSDDIDDMNLQEYKETISKMLESLDEQERIGALKLIKRRAETYEDEAKRDPYPVMSFKKLIYLDLQSMVESHNAALLHKASTLSIDVGPLISAASSSDDLLPEEILLLSKLNGKSSAEELPGYFTHEYRINYQKSLEKLFSSGFLSFAPLEYRLGKMKVPALKELLAEKNIPAKGKKDDLVNLLMGSIAGNDLEKIPEYYIATESGTKLLEDNAALLLYYNGFSHAKWASPKDVVNKQISHYFDEPKANPHDILMELINESIYHLESIISSYQRDFEVISSWKNNGENQ